MFASSWGVRLTREPDEQVPETVAPPPGLPSIADLAAIAKIAPGADTAEATRLILSRLHDAQGSPNV